MCDHLFFLWLKFSHLCNSAVSPAVAAASPQLGTKRESVALAPEVPFVCDGDNGISLSNLHAL
jgi:hypothetical protein